MPVDYEFELNITKFHKDVTIEPLKGEIKGEGKQTLKIAFNPTSCSTAVCEFELHLSEFDFQPISCRISGSGMPHPPKSPQSRHESMIETGKKGTLSKVLEKPEIKQSASKTSKTLLSLKGPGKQFLIVRNSKRYYL